MAKNHTVAADSGEEILRREYSTELEKHNHNLAEAKLAQN